MSGILGNWYGAPRMSAGYAAWDDFWYRPAAQGGSLTGIEINDETAMRQSVVFACVRAISDDIAKLPLKLYRREANGDRTEIRDHPAIRTLRRRPNPRQNRYQFLWFHQALALLRGNSYAIQRTNRRTGALERLDSVHPDVVRVELLDSGRKRYKIREKGGVENTYLHDEVIHLAPFSLDGVMGSSTLEFARESAGLALAAEQYGASVFRNQAKPSMILKHPGQLSAEARKNLEESIAKSHGGFGNAGKVLVAEEGMEATPWSMTSEDAEWMSSRKFQAEDLLRFFRVPPHKVGIMDRATFSNIEHQALEYVQDCLGGHLILWEQTLDTAFLDENEEDLYFEFNVDGLLRGDAKARWEAYKTQLMYGAATINEIRRRENANGIGEPGDVAFFPQNMATAEAVAEGKTVSEKNRGGPGGDPGGAESAHAPEPAREAAAPLLQVAGHSSADGWARDQLEKLARSVAERVVTREISALSKEWTKSGPLTEEALAEFYDQHAEFMAKATGLSLETAKAWGRARAHEVQRTGLDASAAPGLVDSLCRLVTRPPDTLESGDEPCPDE